jgi:hypothetical protein
VADLVTHVLAQARPFEPAVALTMNFWCPPCRTVHGFDLADVQRIVYCLSIDAASAWGDSHASDGNGPNCLLDVLRWAEADRRPGTHSEHVEQCVTAREAHDG